MSTHGVISLRENGVMMAKLVAGCNGNTAKKTAEALRKYGEYKPDWGDLIRESRHNVFGCDADDCLLLIVRVGKPNPLEKPIILCPSCRGECVVYDKNYPGQYVTMRCWDCEDGSYPVHRFKNYERWIKTFDDPNFNPIFEDGSCEFVEILDFERKTHV